LLHHLFFTPAIPFQLQSTIVYHPSAFRLLGFYLRPGEVSLAFGRVPAEGRTKVNAFAATTTNIENF